jgi:hypothetical protein
LGADPGPRAERRDGRYANGQSSDGRSSDGRRAGMRWHRWARLSRAKRIALIASAVVLFLAISALLARFLSTENVERDDLLTLLQAEASGDEQGMLARLSGCRASPVCVASVRRNAAAARRSGSVKILSLTSHTAYSLTGATGPTRVAWTVIGHLPTVQCVKVRRTGNFITGVSVALLSLSAPIPNEGDC